MKKLFSLLVLLLLWFVLLMILRNLRRFKLLWIVIFILFAYYNLKSSLVSRHPKVLFFLIIILKSLFKKLILLWLIIYHTLWTHTLLAHSQSFRNMDQLLIFLTDLTIWILIIFLKLGIYELIEVSWSLLHRFCIFVQPGLNSSICSCEQGRIAT